MAKKKVAPTEEPKTLTAAEVKARALSTAASINKSIGSACIVDVDDAPSPYGLRRPSGIAQLDIDTGGGLPAGGLTYISGPDGAGKTMLLYNYFKLNQCIYKEASSILMVVSEFLPDYRLMRRVGAHVPIPNKVLDDECVQLMRRGMPPLTAEERDAQRTLVGTFHVARAHTAEQVFNLIIEAYAKDAYQIIALDSVSILQAEAEASLDTLSENPQQAANARLITRFHQRWHPLAVGIDKVINTSLIFTAQVRSNRKKSEAPAYIQKYMKEWTNATGANAGRHGKMIDIQLNPGSVEKAKEDGTKVAVGKEVRWEITKGKAGTHDGITGSYDYNYDRPGDHVQELVNTGIRYGVVREQEGKLTFLHAYYKTPLVINDTSLEGITMAQFRELLQQQPDIDLCIRREVYDAGGAKNIVF